MRGAIILVGLSVLSACSAAKPDSKPAANPPQVRIAQIGSETAVSRVTAVGTVALRRETSLGFTSAGRIASLLVNEGDSVARGQKLAALDTTTTGADLSSARAERERAAAELGRSLKLFEQGWVTRVRVDNARAALQSADARVRSAGFQSNNAVITASGAGTILARLAEPGQVVAAGTAVLVLGESASGMVLRVPLSESDAARVRVGAPAEISIAGSILRGAVSEIAGRADRATGTFATEIALPADPNLRSGQIGSAAIVASGTGVTTLTVPPSAIFAARAGQAFVYVVDPRSNRVAVRRVNVAEVGDGSIRVTGGVQRGEWVATSRIDRLANGMMITPLRRAP